VDHDRVDNTFRLPGGHQLEIGLVPDNDFNAPNDILILAIREKEPAWGVVDLYDVYRDGPGWQQLHDGLNGEPADMAAAHQWWLANRDSPLLLGYRSLVAMEAHLRDPQMDLAKLLPPHPNLPPDALVNTLMDLRMLGINPDGRFGLTTKAEAVLRPAHAATLQQFSVAMAAALRPADPRTRQAFPRSPRPGLSAAPGSRGDTMPPSPPLNRPAASR
jgi:hypothetical protein